LRCPAAPVAAGVFGLVRSRHPDWSNDQIIRQVLLTADNIDGVNSQYQNRLGHGRVNAYRALTDSVLIEPDARLELFACTIDDSTHGNNDGMLDPGETIRLHVNIQNCSIGSAAAASFQLASAGSDIGAASSRSQVPMRRSRGIVNVRLSQAVSSS